MPIEKVIVLEDDQIVRNNLENCLRRRRYDVASVATIAAAQECLAKDNFDVIFLDVRLPDGDGTDLLKLIQARPQKPLASKPEAPIMPKRKEKSAPKPPQAPPPEAIWNALEGITPVTFMDLEAEHCRWPVTGGFCGCQKDDDSSYCSTHRALASHPASPLRLLNPHRTSLST